MNFNLFTRTILPILIICFALYLSFQLLVKKNYGILKNERAPKPKDSDKFCNRIGIATLVFIALIALEIFIPTNYPMVRLVIEFATVIAYVFFYKFTDDRFG